MFIKKTANIWLPILFVLVLVGATFANLRLASAFQLQDDFAPRWMAAREWMRSGASPYSESTFNATIDLLKANGNEPSSMSQGRFFDPAWYVLFYLPISFVPYTIARAIWMTFIELSLVLSVFISIRLAGLKLSVWEILLMSFLALVFYPFFKTILTVSVNTPYVFLTLLAVYLARNRQGTLAGLLFAISMWMVPLSVFLVILFLIWLGARRDTSLAKIYFSSLAFFMVVSLILFPNWTADWFATYLRLFPDFSWVRTPLMVVGGLFPGASTQIAISLSLVMFIMILVEWYGIGEREGRGFHWKLMLTLNLLYVFNLTSDGIYLVWLLAPLFSVYKYLTEKWHVSGRIVAWVTYLALIFIHWRRFQLTQNWLPEETSLVILLLPTITFLGLQWFRWWATVSPKALIDSIKD
ncbi:MAG TPA: glycosyltransferase family 87 protein [Anaerolineaceae bacterium]|nr:glycosyltransferase family 87 protein [Anaerolineaceae bacterium]